MSREIKFRVWDDVFCRYWFTDYDLSLEGIAKRNFSEAINWYQLHWEQYTGLKDTNGVEIYMYDILKVTLENTRVEIIVIKDLKEFITNSIYCSYYEVEVVGNIHENKELLK